MKQNQILIFVFFIILLTQALADEKILKLPGGEDDTKGTPALSEPNGGVKINDLTVTQLHKNYDDIPHKYRLDVRAVGPGSMTATWKVNCGYIVGSAVGDSISWHYDKVGECVNAKVEVIVTDIATGDGQKLVQSVFNPEDRVITDIKLEKDEKKVRECENGSILVNKTVCMICENEGWVTKNCCPIGWNQSVSECPEGQELYETESAFNVQCFRCKSKEIVEKASEEFTITESISDDLDTGHWTEPVTIGVQKISNGKFHFVNLLATDEEGDYYWNFGDGMTSTDSNPKHAYSSAGEYIVTLTTTSPEGMIATQTMPLIVKQGAGFFPSVLITLKSVLKIFGFADESQMNVDKETKVNIGAFQRIQIRKPIKISHDGRYAWGTTNTEIATVNAEGIVTFTDEIQHGDIVGIIAQNEEEEIITYFQYWEEEVPEGMIQLFVVGDPAIDYKGNLIATSMLTTQANLDKDLVSATPETSDTDTEAAESVKGYEKGVAEDIGEEIAGLKGKETIYKIVRKLYDSVETMREMPKKTCECWKIFRDHYLTANNDYEAQIGFHAFCVCIYGLTGTDEVVGMFHNFCLLIGEEAPVPKTDFEKEAYVNMVNQLDIVLTECFQDCEKAKEDCEKTKDLAEQAKRKAEEAKRYADEVKEAKKRVQDAKKRAEEAKSNARSARIFEDEERANLAAKEVNDVARDADNEVLIARKKADDARISREEALTLIREASELCPGKCPHRDGSSEIRAILKEANVLLSDAQKGENEYYFIETVYKEIVSTADLVAGEAEVITEIAKAKRKESCEKALGFANAALKAAKQLEQEVGMVESAVKIVADAKVELGKIEKNTQQIRTKKYISSRSRRLKEQVELAEKEFEKARLSLDNAKKAQEDVNSDADNANKIIEQAQNSLKEGSLSDSNCKEVAKLLEEAKTELKEAKDYAKAIVDSTQQDFNAAKTFKNSIKELRDDWEDKRGKIKVCRYINVDGEEVIWGGNGDAEPPGGCEYLGTMEDGKWIDGGPPT